MSGCKNCLLPIQVAGSQLDAKGVCAPCRAYSKEDRSHDEIARETREADLERALKDCRGKAEYDCLVCFSGGKDSAYLLYKLKREYGLNVLAYTTDMNVPPIAWDNIRRTLDKLDVDHISYRPPRGFYRKLYRFLLTNQEERGAVRTVCYICAPLFEGYAIREATDREIPLVVAAYSPGQPDPDRMFYEFVPDRIANIDWTPPEVRESGEFSEQELALFWNPLKYPEGTAFPRYLAPFHAWKYSQEDVMQKVVELGLILDQKHASPVHSNCPLNWLLMHSDLKNLGYNPYAPEFSALIREGKAKRSYWKPRIPFLNFMIKHKILLGKQAQESMEWLGLGENDLKIKRPAVSEWGRLRHR